MVNLTVYGNLKATCTQRILILLEELSLKYKFVNVDIFGGEQKEDSYLELNPFGKVPVVKYGNKTLYESRTILRYIAKNNREMLDLLGDVNVDIWLEVESNNFNPHISSVVYEKLFKKMLGGECDDTVVERELEKLGRVLDIYDKRLEGTEYIGGDRFSIADISHIPYAYCFLKCGYKNELKKRPNVYKWLKKIIRRDSVKSVLDGSCLKKNEEESEENEYEENGSEGEEY